MGLRKWWRNADPIGKQIIKWFGAAVLVAIIISMIKCGA
jgi:hypothetical protein